MEQNTKNALFSDLANEDIQYFKGIYAGVSEFTDKETKKTTYCYRVVLADFKNQTADIQKFYVEKPFDSKIDFLTPCVIGLDVKVGSKYSTLVSIEPLKK